MSKDQPEGDEDSRYRLVAPLVGPEPDCVHWVPGALDVEPEQCFCLSCGEASPCMTCRVQSTTKQKEPSYA